MEKLEATIEGSLFSAGDSVGQENRESNWTG